MPGRMLLVDTNIGSIIKDEELKQNISTQRPVKQWIEHNLLTLDNFRDSYIKKNGKGPDEISQERESLSMGGRSVETDRRMPLFGYSVEDLNMLLLPMIVNSYVSKYDVIDITDLFNSKSLEILLETKEIK